MNIELIPVIEIGYHNQGVESPTNYPYWDYPNEWQAYCDTSYLKAGFKDKFIPYLEGSGLYRPKYLTDNNLIKIVEDHMSLFESGEIGEDRISPLFGGYVLKIEGKDLLFPQCCSDLGDWVYWNSIVEKQDSINFSGHPSPVLEFNADRVIFNCKDEYESFVPITDGQISVDLNSLKIAYNNMMSELEEFAIRVSELSGKFRFKTESKPLEEILIFS